MTLSALKAAPMLEQPSVLFRAYRNGNQTIPRGVGTTVGFNALIGNNIQGGSLNTSTGVFTAPEAGLYLICIGALYSFENVGWDGEGMQMVLRAGPSTATRTYYLSDGALANTTSNYQRYHGPMIVEALNAGDVVYMQVSGGDVDAGGGGIIYGGTAYTEFSVIRLGPIPTEAYASAYGEGLGAVYDLGASTDRLAVLRRANAGFGTGQSCPRSTWTKQTGLTIAENVGGMTVTTDTITPDKPGIYLVHGRAGCYYSSGGIKRGILAIHDGAAYRLISDQYQPRTQSIMQMSGARLYAIANTSTPLSLHAYLTDSTSGGGKVHDCDLTVLRLCDLP